MIGDLVTDYLDPRGVGFNLVYIGMIIFFAYFYTGVMINPETSAQLFPFRTCTVN